MKRKTWTEEEFIFLKTNYEAMDYALLAKTLNRDIKAVREKLSKSGLTLSTEERSRRLSLAGIKGNKILSATRSPSEVNTRSGRYRRRNPEKCEARDKVHYALKKGRIQKEVCVVCGEPRVHAHHETYAKPLDVVWLCDIHHNNLHSGILNKAFILLR